MNRPVVHIASTTQALLVIVAAVAMMSCIHTYPSPEGGEDPTEIAVELSVRLEADWENFGVTVADEDIFRSKDNNPSTRSAMQESWSVRIITVITDKNGRTSTRTRFFEHEEISEDRIVIPLANDLHANIYHIAVWADYLDKVTHEPLGYDTGRFPLANEIVRRGTESERRMCLYGSAEVDLSKYKGSWNVVHRSEITLSPPVTRFRLIAEDYEEFLDFTEEARNHNESYFITVTYESEVPLSFNITEGYPMDPEEGCGFTLPFPIINIPGLEMAIASDWLFCPSYPVRHTVSLTVYNSAKVAVAHVADIRFPVEAGKLTTVRGKFLTNFITGGIHIDNIWGGEIIIELE